MYILAKSIAAAKRIRLMLEKNPPNRDSKFFDFGIDFESMEIEVAN